MPVSINPATETQIGHYPAMSQGEVEDIARTVHQASLAWRKESIEDRAEALGRVACRLEDNKETYARLITSEMGKPIKESRAEIGKCAWVCRYYQENGPEFLKDELLDSDSPKSYACFQPLGVVLAVMPWNFPFWQVFRFAAPGLSAGNGVVLKHASNVCGCALAIESVFRDAGVPSNLFRTIITGPEEVGQLIGSDLIQAATLTGSEDAGSAVAAAAGKAIKKTVLELGGNDPYLILDDADLELAAETCAQSRLINTGQSCIAAKRFIVVNQVKEVFLEKFINRISYRIMGNPALEETDLGPMARPDLRDDLNEQVQRSLTAGARVSFKGSFTEETGYYYPVTVLDNISPGMPAADEELFGPVAAIITVEDTDAAIGMANKSYYGLGSAVFTRDRSKGEAVARQLQAGACFINDFVKSDPRLPFGGIKRSGFGRELSCQGIREFVNLKTIVVA